ncbi:MAG: metallophosphoesterase [Paludibacter sp.]
MKLYTEVYLILLLLIFVTDYFLHKQLKNRIHIYKIFNFSIAAFFVFSFTWIKFFSIYLIDYKLPAILMWFNLFFLCIYIPKIVILIFNILKKKYKNQIVALNSVQYMVLSAFIFIVFYSSFVTPFQFKVRKTEVILPTLPPAFNNFKIVQLSDIHLGSRPFDKEFYKTMIQIVNNQHPDMVVFTGDMVNNFAEEMIGYKELFKKIKASEKYAILGNHDYGDYSKWNTEQAKADNLNKIKSNFEAFGFKLLLNKHVFIYSNKDSIALIGVENYYKNPKKNYAKLDKAIEGIKTTTFQLLLSHNPTQWEQEVLKHKEIKLTLSGHTHAAQMGTEIFGKILSPAFFIYKQYNGLYSINEQKLYVSRGIGYIGLPILIGLNPEISVITLKSK